MANRASVSFCGMAVSTALAVLLAAGCSSTPAVEEAAPGDRPGDTPPQPAREEQAGEPGKEAAAAGTETAAEPRPENETGQPAIDEERETVSIVTVIERLEDSYRTQDYELWLNLLTPAYRRRYSDPRHLEAEGWDAADLRSFFKLLVKTRKRENIGSLEISRVEFVSPTKALVYVLLAGEEFPVPQHTFIRRGDTWYKGLKEEE